MTGKTNVDHHFKRFYWSFKLLCSVNVMAMILNCLVNWALLYYLVYQC